MADRWKKISIGVALLFILLVYLGRGHEDKMFLQSNYKGVVEHLRYDIKGFPYVTIKGKELPLHNIPGQYDVKIWVGNTLLKKKGDCIIRILRPGFKDTIYFNSGKEVEKEAF